VPALTIAFCSRDDYFIDRRPMVRQQCSSPSGDQLAGPSHRFGLMATSSIDSSVLELKRLKRKVRFDGQRTMN
jgi:hypothetical protein